MPANDKPANTSRPKPRSPIAVDPRSFEVPAPSTGATAPRATTPRARAQPAGNPPTPTAPKPAKAARSGSTKRKVIWTAAGVLGIFVLLLTIGLTYAWRTYGRIEKIPVADVLTPGSGSGTNFLIVGTDSREGLSDDVGNKGALVGDGVAGERTDTLVLMRISPSGNTMLPLPRDLWVTIADSGSNGRINSAIQGGPSGLIRTVQDSLGLPVHHYVEIDFAGFLELVDAVGGVTIDFDAPAYDQKSGLAVDSAGPHTLDKDAALAFVRSRAYTRVVDGKQIVDPTGDLGRIQRQQMFLRSVMSAVGGTRNPFTLASIGGAVASNMKVDDALGFRDSLSLARKLAGLNPETVDLPVTPIRTSGGADVLVLKEPAATETLNRFRN